jgi:hypothetical protein
MMRAFHRRAASLAAALLAVGAVAAAITVARAHDLGSPAIRTIFTGADMPNSERVVATLDGRVFVSSARDIFEVVRNGQGGFDEISIAQASVTLPTGAVVPGAFVGLKPFGHLLFATATAEAPGNIPLGSMLYRIDLAKRDGDPRRVVSAPFVDPAPFLPNGMTIDGAGDIFVSNSFSAVTGAAAIVEITVTGTAPLTFTETPWLPAVEGGAFPNGLQLDGRSFILDSLNQILRIAIAEDGTAGTVTLVREESADTFLDDLAVFPGFIIVCELGSDAANPLSGAPPTAAQLSVISTRAEDLGRVLDVIPLFAAGVLPSSVMASSGRVFPRGALLVTDFLTGGFFELTFK